MSVQGGLLVEMGASTDARPALVELGVQAIAGDESCLTVSDVAREVKGPVSQVSMKIARSAFVESAEIVGGRVTVPDRPGLGVVVDPEALSRHRSDG